jgi:hypothetical protein
MGCDWGFWYAAAIVGGIGLGGGDAGGKKCGEGGGVGAEETERRRAHSAGE